MLNKKLLLSLSIFSILMIFTSIIKTQTRIIEKDIYFLQKKNASLENNLYESQLDHTYLSTPSAISSKIMEFSDQEYTSLEYSKIYFGLEQFINEHKKTTKFFLDEKKK